MAREIRFGHRIAQQSSKHHGQDSRRRVVADRTGVRSRCAASPRAPTPRACYQESLNGVAIVSALWCLWGFAVFPGGPISALCGMNAKQIKWGDRTWMNMGEQVRHMPSPRRCPRPACCNRAGAALLRLSLVVRALR